MVERCKKCSCGHSAYEMNGVMAYLEDVLRGHEQKPLYKGTINIFIRGIDQIRNNLKDVREFCEINVDEEDKRLGNVKSTMSTIGIKLGSNRSIYIEEKNREILNDIIFVSDSIRDKLFYCKENEFIR